MSFSFASLGHALASGFQTVAKGFEWVVSEAGKVEGSENIVETLTGLIPGASSVVNLEKLGYASLGVIVAAVKSGDAALTQNLLNAGADESFIQEIEQVIQQFPSIIQDAENAFKAQTPAVTAAAKQASIASVQALKAKPSQTMAAPVAVEA